MAAKLGRTGTVTVAYLALAIALVLLSVYLAPGTTWLWALDGWSRLLDGSALVVAGGMLAVGLATYGLSRLSRGWQRSLALAMLAASSAAAAWYLRLDRSLGDRTIFLEMLTHGQVFRMSQPLTTAIYAALHAVTQAWDWPPRSSIALACSLAAAGAVVALVEFVTHLPDRQARALSLILPSSGLVVLFFGYVESTVVTVVLDLLYLYLAWKVMGEQAALWKPSLVLALAILCHGLSVYLLPSLILLAFWTWRDNPHGWWTHRRTYSAALALVIPFLLVALAAFSFPALIRGRAYGDALGGQDMRPFVPLFAARHSTERYTLFSIPHLADLANVSFLASPSALLFVALALVHSRRALRTRWNRFLYLAGLCGLLMAFLWNPDLGMWRDWDLFSPLLLPLLLLGATLLAGQPGPAIAGCAVLSAVNSALLLSAFAPVATWSPAISALPTPQVAYATDIVWVGKFELLGFDLRPESVEPGQDVTLTLHLRGLEPMPVGYTVFLHLVDAQGQMLSQDDHQPYPPTEYWPPGELYTASYVLRVPPDLAPGTALDVKIGAYFYQTLERLPLRRDGAGVENGLAPLATLHLGRPISPPGPGSSDRQGQ